MKCNLSLEASHLGAFPFGSRVTPSSSRSSLSPAPTYERSTSYDSLFGATPSPSSSPAPLPEQSDHSDGPLDCLKDSTRLLDSDLDTTETSDEAGSETEGDDDQPEDPPVVNIRNDEDEQDEKEVEELLRFEPDDDSTLSTNSCATTPRLNPSTPEPTSVPTPALTLASISDYADTATTLERVQYEHRTSHPTGKFEHQVGLDHDEPMQRSEYLQDSPR